MIADKFAQAAHVFVAIDAFEGIVRRGDARFGVGESQADLLAAVIERQDFALFLQVLQAAVPLFLRELCFTIQYSVNADGGGVRSR